MNFTLFIFEEDKIIALARMITVKEPIDKRNLFSRIVGVLPEVKYMASE